GEVPARADRPRRRERRAWRTRARRPELALPGPERRGVRDRARTTRTQRAARLLGRPGRPGRRPGPLGGAGEPPRRARSEQARRLDRGERPAPPRQVASRARPPARPNGARRPRRGLSTGAAEGGESARMTLYAKPL